jgi:spermidine synthase
MTAQILFLRRFLVVFSGNELSVGIIIANWMVWGAVGSWLAGVISVRVRRNLLVFSLCQFLTAFLLLLTYLFISAVRPVMGYGKGEIIGYTGIFLSSFVALGSICAVMGGMFSLGCRLYADRTGEAGKGINSVYILESSGALAGGLLSGYLMIRYFHPLQVLIALSAANSILAVLNIKHSCSGARFKKFLMLVLLVYSSAALFCSFSGKWKNIKEYSDSLLWGRMKVLETEDTIYGNVTSVGSNGQVSFYENGLYMFTVPDLLSAEQSAHFNLLNSIKGPRVLLIGGGGAGILEEIMKYDIERADYIELDPEVVRMVREYAPGRPGEILNARKVSVINTDGRKFVKNTDNEYDSVIISLGDPYTAQINRFYTYDFFRELGSLMSEKGVLSFGLTSSENYISEESADYLGSVYMTLRKVFADVMIVPGDTMYFISAKKKGILHRNVRDMMRIKEERGIRTDFMHGYYLDTKMSAERSQYAYEKIVNAGGKMLNRDFRPISYYFSSLFWSTQFSSDWIRSFLSSVTSGKIWGVLFGLCLGGLLLKKYIWTDDIGAPVLIAVAVTGFSEIIFQICIVVAFQVIYGYVFYKLAVIFALFMSGLAAGSFVFYRYVDGKCDTVRFFRGLQKSIAFYPAILPLVFLFLSAPVPLWIYMAGSVLIFPVLSFLAGFAGGLQFPAANRILIREAGVSRVNSGSRIAGRTYALDLGGAAIGALTASAVLIPVSGIITACIFCAVLNSFVFVTLRT